MPVAKSTTTTVLTRVARLEGTWLTPILASTAVSPAKSADSAAYKVQFTPLPPLTVDASNILAGTQLPGEPEIRSRSYHLPCLIDRHFQAAEYLSRRPCVWARVSCFLKQGLARGNSPIGRGKAAHR